MEGVVVPSHVKRQAFLSSHLCAVRPPWPAKTQISGPAGGWSEGGKDLHDACVDYRLAGVIFCPIPGSGGGPRAGPWTPSRPPTLGQQLVFLCSSRSRQSRKKLASSDRLEFCGKGGPLLIFPSLCLAREYGCSQSSLRYGDKATPPSPFLDVFSLRITLCPRAVAGAAPLGRRLHVCAAGRLPPFPCPFQVPGSRFGKGLRAERKAAGRRRVWRWMWRTGAGRWPHPRRRHNLHLGEESRPRRSEADCAICPTWDEGVQSVRKRQEGERGGKV